MLTTALILLPNRPARWRCSCFRPAPRRSDRLRSSFALAEVGLWVSAMQRFNFSSAKLQFEQAPTPGFATSASAYHVGLFQLLDLAGRADRVVMAAVIAYAVWNGREPGERLLLADALPARCRRLCARGAGHDPVFLRRLRGDDDSPLRADSAFGARWALESDLQILSPTRSPVRF